jgi:Flp pilus assembly protein TadD
LAREERNQGTQMSGNVRVIDRYAAALWDIGHVQRSFDVQRDYTVTSLDVMAVMDMSLRREFMIKLNEARWEPQAMSRLKTEYELGNALLLLSQLTDSSDIDGIKKDPKSSPEILAGLEAMKSLITAGTKQRIKTISFQLGYHDGVIPADSWFLLDFRLVQQPLDLKAFCLAPSDGCRAPVVAQERREPSGEGIEGVAGAAKASSADVELGSSKKDAESVSAADWYMRGQLAITPREKIAAYSRALQLSPRDLPSLTNRCLAYRDVGEYSAAVADCEQAIKLAPRVPETYNNLGWAYHGQRDHIKAIEAYTRALDLNPRLPSARKNRADAYVESGRLREAVADREELLRLYPGEASSYNGLAWVLIDQEIDVDRGIEYAKRAVAIRPDDANTLDTLGWGYFRKKRYDEAVRVLTKAVRLDPANAEIQQHLESARRAWAARPPQ